MNAIFHPNCHPCIRIVTNIKQVCPARVTCKKWINWVDTVRIPRTDNSFLSIFPIQGDPWNPVTIMHQRRRTKKQCCMATFDCPFLQSSKTKWKRLCWLRARHFDSALLLWQSICLTQYMNRACSNLATKTCGWCREAKMQTSSKTYSQAEDQVREKKSHVDYRVRCFGV